MDGARRGLGLAPLLAAALGLAPAGAHAQAPPAPDPAGSGWTVTATPYLWMAGFEGFSGGTAKLPPVHADLSFGDVVNALDFGLMGAVEARHGRWIALADAMYIDLSAGKNIALREAAQREASLDVKNLYATMVGAYRVVDGPKGQLDLLAGLRVTSFDGEVKVKGPLAISSGGVTKTWVDPVVGARFAWPLGKGWTFTAYGDVGGFGVSSISTWQLYALAEHPLSRHWSANLGWRRMRIDYADDPFVFDVTLDGPVVGAAYRF
jgi:hypothetical protein